MFRVLRTSDLEPRDRFALWQSLVSDEAAPVHVHTRFADNFAATLRVVQFGALTTMAMEHPPLEVERTPALIRRSDPDLYHLVLNLSGQQRIDQDRSSAVLRPGDMTIYHTSRPMRTYSDPGITREAAVVVAIPRDQLPAARGVTAMPIPGDSGIGLLTANYLRTLGRLDDATSPVEGDRLAGVTLDLISVLLARMVGDPDELCPGSVENVQFARVQAYISARLGDAELTPRMIARANHMSVRTLQRLFQAHGTTVVDWIRRRRLEACRRDLADPRVAALSVAAIGRRWGFIDPSQFSRAFRSAYGLSPRAYRIGAVNPLTAL